MTDSRHGERTGSSEICELELRGSRYHCRLDNISPAGAMVTCLGFLQEAWPGDKGVLRRPDDGKELTCQITHIEASKIGLRFDE